jgi:oxygen-independent coproporphyrinogen-3 oxidase
MFDLRIVADKPVFKFNRQLPMFNWHYPFHYESERLLDPCTPFKRFERVNARRRAVYIHIPFCDTLCNFCLFKKTKYQSDEHIQRYVDALIAEFEHKRRFLGSYEVDAIFVGGGTPSVLNPAQIELLGKAISQNLDLHNLKEFTFEVEVKSVTRDKLHALQSIGVNRISFGAQTFSPKYRALFSLDATIERIQATAALINSEFAYTNVDILYGMAGQDEGELYDDAEEALRLQTTTIDFYPINNLTAPRLMHRLIRKAGLGYLPATTRVQYRRYIDTLLRSRGYAPINGYGYSLADTAAADAMVVQHTPKFLYHDLVYGYDDDEIIGYGSSAISQMTGFNLLNIADHASYVTRVLENRTLPHEAYEPVASPERGIVSFPFRGVLDKSRVPWARVPDETWVALQEAIDAGLVIERSDRYELTSTGWLFYVNLMYYFMPERSKKWITTQMEKQRGDGRDCGDTDLSELIDEPDDRHPGARLGRSIPELSLSS